MVSMSAAATCIPLFAPRRSSKEPFRQSGKTRSHYKDKYGKYGICTAEECDAALLGERTKGSRRT